MTNEKVALITGSARRVGAVIARMLHNHHFNIIIHYRASAQDAEKLRDEFNAQRPHSAISIISDMNDTTALPQLVQTAAKTWGRLDVLINNASTFYPREE